MVVLISINQQDYTASSNDSGKAEVEPVVVREDKMTQRVQGWMDNLYTIIHVGRWPIFIACMVGLGVASYFAQKISLPENTEVRMLSKSHPMERLQQNYKNLLSSYLREISTGATVDVHFGVNEEDFGDLYNPDVLSSLVLDDTFDPSTTAAQEYLLQFCDRLFENPFVYKPYTDYVCSVNRFDDWLGTQSLLPQAERAPGYNNECKGAGSLPMLR